MTVSPHEPERPHEADPPTRPAPGDAPVRHRRRLLAGFLAAALPGRGASEDTPRAAGRTRAADPATPGASVPPVDVDVDVGAGHEPESGPYRPPPRSPLRVAPGVEGFGADTPAGRGGRVVVVTSAESRGPGTLHEALTTPGDRLVLFDVSGPITLPGPTVVSAGKVSVYGQSAPGDGVCLTSDPENVHPTLQIRSDDVLFQHCRFRPGAARSRNGSRDAFNVGDPDRAIGRVVADHCSFSWATDEVVDLWHGAHDVTISRCLIYEGLFDSTSTASGPQSYPMIIGGGAHRVSVVQSVLANGDYRFPALFGCHDVDVFNNVIALYTGDPTPLQCQYTSHDLTGNIEANLYIDAAGSADAEIQRYVNVDSDAVVRLHVAGNGRVVAEDSAIGPIRVAVEGRRVDASEDPQFNRPRMAAPRPPSIPLERLEAALLEDVGARRPTRDAADARVISRIRARRLQPVDLVGGRAVTARNAARVGTSRDVPWPTLRGGPSRLGDAPDRVPLAWKRANGLPAGTDAAATDSNGDGYLDIEDWLAEPG